MADGRGGRGNSRGANDEGGYGNGGRGERGYGDRRKIVFTKPTPYGRNRDGTPSTKAERDAWNAKKQQTGLSGEALYQSLQPQVDPYAELFAMFEEGKPHEATAPHPASGPNDADLQTAGLNDLNSAYGDYNTAATTATDYINDQISRERADAALSGVGFGITDEEKSSRISNYFADIWSSDDQSNLDTLNTKWGEFLDTPLEFLITRGVSSADQQTDTVRPDRTGATPQGSTISTGLLAENDPQQSTILGG